MKRTKSTDVVDLEEAQLAQQQAEEKTYGVSDTEELEYAERAERERLQQSVYQPATRQLAQQRDSLAPRSAVAFKAFSREVFAKGALPIKTKQLIAIAVAHVTQCPYCIRSHTKAALQSGATSQEIMEAIWVAAEMRAGGAYAHSILALDAMAHNPSVRRP